MGHLLLMPDVARKEGNIAATAWYALSAMIRAAVVASRNKQRISLRGTKQSVPESLASASRIASFAENLAMEALG